jgi:extracellular matrix protein 14
MIARFDHSRMSGDSIDYAYGSAKIRWSYSVELRDTGTVSDALRRAMVSSLPGGY